MEERTQAEESLEERINSEEEIQGEASSSSTQNLAIGRRLPALIVPLVEGLIVGRKVKEDGSSDVSFILAPYCKKGTWVKAAVFVKNSVKLTKKSFNKYTYPLPWGEKLALEAARNKGDSEWVRATINDINLCFKVSPKEKECVEEGVEDRTFVLQRKKSSVSSSSNDSRGSERNELFRSPHRRSRRISALRKWSKESTRKERDLKDEQKGRGRSARNSIWGNNPQVRRNALKTVRSSSESQRSEQKGDLEDKEVWETEEEDDGMVFCPFSSKDIRRFIDIKESIKGRATERRFLRQALQNLYRHFTTLQTFVDTVRSKALHSANQPFPTDLIWLEYHALYIDSLLFENLRGMWAGWNEPVLDLLVMTFLEFLVRCTPKRQYPDKLEERVRRWMKKNQVGISTAYGPVPYYLQNAKVTERGVTVNNSYYSPYGRGRSYQSGTGRGEGRGRGNSNSSSGFRRGGQKADSKNSANE